jgi:ketosteroid isomerase-like protein
MQKHIETVQAIYAAFGRGDIGAILGHLAPEVEWEHDAVDHGIPRLKQRRGPAEVARFFETLGALEFKRFEPKQFLVGDNAVAATIGIELAAKATGKPIRDLELHLWTFGADGKVTRFKHLVDTHQHFLAWRG